VKGADFDRDYIAAQIQEHQAALDLIDSILLVQVKNPELKAAIEAFRPKVEHHLNEAKAIQSSSRLAK
jgi:putative membrane protein